MIRVLWAVARNDLAVWRRSPWAVAAALFPALAMGALMAVLTASVGRQPVALVVRGQGPLAAHMTHLIQADSEAYLLQTMTAHEAERALQEQRVAAVVIIPENFDQQVADARAQVELLLNNVDLDFSDDIRRSVTRSVAEFDAPQLGIVGELHGPSRGFVLPNPYRIAVAERDLCQTNVSFLHYQVVPVLILIVLSLGLLGTALLAARDFERRTVRLLLLSPAHRANLVAGRLLGGVLITGAVMTPLVLLGATLGILHPPQAHWPAFLALLGAVTVMAVGLGLLLGVALRRGRLVTMAGLSLATYFFFLGGGFTTVAFLPRWMQVVSQFVPTSYAIAGLRQTLFYPDLLGVNRDLLVLSGSAVAAAALGTVALARAWRRA